MPHQGSWNGRMSLFSQTEKASLFASLSEKRLRHARSAGSGCRAEAGLVFHRLHSSLCCSYSLGHFLQGWRIFCYRQAGKAHPGPISWDLVKFCLFVCLFITEIKMALVQMDVSKFDHLDTKPICPQGRSEWWWIALSLSWRSRGCLGTQGSRWLGIDSEVRAVWWETGPPVGSRRCLKG